MNIEQDMRDSILQDLVELGNTSEEVAAKLLALGVCGQKGEPSSCPIYYYLLTRKGHTQVRAVTGVYVRTSDLGYHHHLMDVPTPVRRFILDFDQGKYPTLECKCKPQSIRIALTDGTYVYCHLSF